jgi:hypothetical protein
MRYQGRDVAGISIPASGTIGRIPQASSTRRRWYQFGLGTMFLLVTLFAVWLGWELHVVRRRAVARKQILACGGHIIWSGGVRGTLQPVREGTRSRLMLARLKLLGEDPVDYLLLPTRATEAEMALADYFPEAKVKTFHLNWVWVTPYQSNGQPVALSDLKLPDN